MILEHKFNKISIHRYIKTKYKIKSIEFCVLRIKNKEILPKLKGEYLIVLLKGKIHVKTGGCFSETIGPRKSVFKDKPGAVFIPSGMVTEIIPKQVSEIVICMSGKKPKSKNLKPFAINPNMVKAINRGYGCYKRTVLNILDENHKADYLMAGETISSNGMWSSYPPHKHDDKVRGENKLEELYYYRLEKENRFAFQGLYSKNKKLDLAWRVKHNDTLAIPFGYHPVSAPPDSKLYYFWVLSGDKRTLKFKNDPDFIKN